MPQGIERQCARQACGVAFRVASDRNVKIYCTVECKDAAGLARRRSESSDDDISAPAIEARYQAALADIRQRRVKDLTA